jgi:hypothetical protein
VTHQLSESVVLRGAYGIFYQPIGADCWAGVPYAFAPGFRGDNRVSAVGGGRPAFNWDSGYPGQEVAAGKDPDFTQWGMVAMSQDGLQAGRLQQWNTGVEFEIIKEFVVGAQYLGTGTDLNSGDLARNQPDMQALGNLLKAGKEWSWVSSDASAAAAAAGVPYPYAGFANYAFMAPAPFPRVAETYGPVYHVGSPLGTQSYLALQLTANKRMSQGIAANAAHSYSRSRSNIDSGFQESWGVGLLQDVTKLDAEAEVIDAIDMTHVVKGFVTWELPLGKGAGTSIGPVLSTWQPLLRSQGEQRSRRDDAKPTSGGRHRPLPGGRQSCRASARHEALRNETENPRVVSRSPAAL